MSEELKRYALLFQQLKQLKYEKRQLANEIERLKIKLAEAQTKIIILENRS